MSPPGESIPPAAPRASQPPRPPGAPAGVGLVLCRGGIAGAMYQLGCLAALEDAVPGFTCNALDMYVGASGGALIAAALAGGLSVQRLYRAMLDPADDFFPLERKHLVRFDSAEWRRLIGSASEALRRAAVSAVTRPSQFQLWAELDRFYDSLPAGVCTLDALEDFLTGFFARRGVPNRFTEMPRPLRIPAYDLDAGARVVFGAPATEHVPVARAVCASSALPILFVPVRIGERDYVDGGTAEVAHLDVLASAGVRVAVVINPLVPARNDPSGVRIPTGHGTMSHVRDKGLMGVSEQAGRIAGRARLDAEEARSRALAPGLELVRLEPLPEDATLFMYSPMNLGARRAILRYGYESTTARVRRDAARIAKVLSGG